MGFDLYLAVKMERREVEAEAGSSSSWASTGQDPDLCCYGKHLIHPWPRPVLRDKNMHLSRELKPARESIFDNSQVPRCVLDFLPDSGAYGDTPGKTEQELNDTPRGSQGCA